MEKAELDRISGWFAGRLPDGWFTEAPSVSLEGEQVKVVGKLAEPVLAQGATAELKSGAEGGRISRFREATRGQRIAIAQEAERLFKVNVQWGAACGATTADFTPGGSGRRQGEGEAAKKVHIGWRRHWAWRRRPADYQRF